MKTAQDDRTGTLPQDEEMAGTAQGRDIAETLKRFATETNTDIVEAIRGFDVENIGLDRFNLTGEERAAIKRRILESLDPGAVPRLTDEDKRILEKMTRQVFAELLDVEPEAVTLEARLVEDLGMDSLAFLEMFDEMKEALHLDLDVNVVARYAQEFPVTTFGEYLDQMYTFIEQRDRIFADMGIDKAELLRGIQAGSLKDL